MLILSAAGRREGFTLYTVQQRVTVDFLCVSVCGQKFKSVCHIARVLTTEFEPCALITVPCMCMEIVPRMRRDRWSRVQSTHSFIDHYDTWCTAQTACWHAYTPNENKKTCIFMYEPCAAVHFMCSLCTYVRACACVCVCVSPTQHPCISTCKHAFLCTPNEYFC